MAAKDCCFHALVSNMCYSIESLLRVNPSGNLLHSKGRLLTLPTNIRLNKKKCCICPECQCYSIKRSLYHWHLFVPYIYIYDNYRIYTLPWDSIWTWLIAAVGYDLGYYWVHRTAHEINFLWAAHQVLVPILKLPPKLMFRKNKLECLSLASFLRFV